MRLIDADTATVMTATCPKGMDIDSFIAGMWAVLDRIEEAPTVPMWHVFKDEQPTKEKTDYLCISYFDIDLPGYDEKSKWDVSIFRFYDGKFWWFSENEEYEQNDVVFWMEIPEYPMVIKDGKID